MSTVLVVEDDRDIRELLRRYLERAGHAVLTTGSGLEALRLVEASHVDLVLLDLGLPDLDGIEVLASARRVNLPVVVLSARSTVEERINGLTAGADDYVTKPFSPTEVVLRVAAVLARASGTTSRTDGSVSFGGGRLQIDAAQRAVSVDGVGLELTPTEWGILKALADAPGRVFSRYELVNRVRGYEFAGYERSIDSHVKNLRHKLGPLGGQAVRTVVGVGYRLGLARD